MIEVKEIWQQTRKTKTSPAMSYRILGPKLCALCLSLIPCIVLLWETNPAQAGPPTDTMKAAIEEIFKVLADESLKQPDQAGKRLQLLEETVEKHFDYEEMAKRTLARHWKALNDQERKKFVALYKRFLSNAYAGKLSAYQGEQVEYLGERVRKDNNNVLHAEVRTKVVSSKLEIPLDYRLINKSKWRCYDVIVDGVSLIRNYRGQFDRIIKSKSFNALLEKLQSKADKLAES